jgi:hypothetical protein
VKQTHESFILHQTAKAFIQLSSIIQILGIGNQRVIQRFSTILYSSGFSFLVSSLAHENENMIFFWAKNVIASIIKRIGTRIAKKSIVASNAVFVIYSLDIQVFDASQ